MTNIAVVVVVLLVSRYVVSVIRRHRRGLVAERGMSIGADLGTLADQRQVRVRAVTKVGPDRVRIILTPEKGPADRPELTTSPDLDLVVDLGDEAFGFGLLEEWMRSQRALAIVMPPDSHIVRLRSIDDLQPLTLRRIEEG